MAYKTEQRKILTDFLSAHPDEFFTPKQIFSAIGSNAISLSAIYRNIAAMEKDGLLVRNNLGCENAYRFTAHCADDIHIVCEKCGRVSHLSSELSGLVDDNLSDGGFTLNKTKTILYGLCSTCKK